MQVEEVVNEKDESIDYNDDEEIRKRAKEHQMMLLKIPPDFLKAEIHGVSFNEESYTLFIEIIQSIQY